MTLWLESAVSALSSILKEEYNDTPVKVIKKTFYFIS
jgi:hypothetical protein